MKADLHFHPSFFSRGDQSHVTEKTTPSLKDIEKKAFELDIDVLTITSCSAHYHIDKRWETYMQEAQEHNNGFYRTILNPQAIRTQSTLNIMDWPTYLIHGQELKTNKGDVNVIFADQRVPIEKSDGDFYWILDAAKDSGENVLIGLNQLSRCKLSLEGIERLCEAGKINFIESFNSMDFSQNNKYALEIAKTTQTPGIAVSDGHRLEDMARAHIIASPRYLSEMSYPELAKYIKSVISKNPTRFTNVNGKCSLTSKFLYTARLTNAIICPKL